MATDHSTSELWRTLPNMEGRWQEECCLSSRTLLSAFPSVGLIQERCAVWLLVGSCGSHRHLGSVSGTIWLHVACSIITREGVEDRGLFAFPFLLYHLVYNRTKCHASVLKMQNVTWRYLFGLFCRCSVRGMLSVSCGLFWGKDLHHMWASCPNLAFLPSSACTQRTSDIHL